VISRYVWLWVFGLALGWFEASVVVYLRALYYPSGFEFPIVLIPDRLALVEIAREAASVVILLAVARLAVSRMIERFAAFALLFGIWDIAYYVFLKLVLGWPSSLAAWDVLFLIPLPWLGPVWAPCIVSMALITGGSWILLTPERVRRYHASEWILASFGGVVVIGTFLADWRAVVENRIPSSFLTIVFWAGLALSVAVFVRAEALLSLARRRAATKFEDRS
jgi:hypothetical protein